MTPVTISEEYFPEVVLNRVPKLNEQPTPVSTPYDAIDYVSRFLRRYTVENLIMITFDNACMPLNYSIISRGTIDQTMVSTQDIVKTMLLSNATGCILLHNHARNDSITGKPQPSKSDIDVTFEVQRALSLFRLRLLDMIIVGPDGSLTSFLEDDIGVFKTMREMVEKKKEQLASANIASENTDA